MRKLKEMIINNQKVRFSFYRDSQLWYETECGFRFPIPIADAGTATFLADDRAILFMRYIRKQMAIFRPGTFRRRSPSPFTIEEVAPPAGNS